MSKLTYIAIWSFLATRAPADPYWVEYGGADFPENETWLRLYGNGGADRHITSGVLTLDSLRSDQIYDAYKFERSINPDIGELFIAEWRIRVLENHGPAGFGDNEVGIARDGGGTLAFQLLPDLIISAREGWSIPLLPGVFHSFRVVSPDMIGYSLWIDNTFVRSGVWDLFSLNESFVSFGDSLQGVRSLAEWDYMRFGVVPEPGSYALLLIIVVVRHCARSTHQGE